MKTLLLTSLITLFTQMGNLANAQLPIFWGTTPNGGTYNYGTIFKVNADGSGWTIVHSFRGYDGTYADCNLAQVNDGKLYGTVSSGGGYGVGTLFSINPTDSTFDNIIEFDTANGYAPGVNLVQASNNLIYGVTGYGGVNGYGSIFSFNPVTDSVITLHSFDAVNGSVPFGGLMQAPDGKLYGVASLGNPAGVLFSFDITTNIFTKLHTFGNTTGTGPSGIPVYYNGSLYGTTRLRGANSRGTIYSYNLSTNICSAVYDFNTASGTSANAGLLLANNGLLYGVNTNSAIGGEGALFSFNPDNNVFTKLFDLAAPDIKDARAALIQGSDGQIYGTSLNGGLNNAGTIFKYTIADSTLATVLSFDSLVPGAHPRAGLMEIKELNTGINKHAENFAARLYPNPATEEVVVNLNGQQVEAIRIFNLQGQLVYEALKPVNNKMNISNLTKGLYIAEVSVGNKKSRLRLVKIYVLS